MRQQIDQHGPSFGWQSLITDCHIADLREMTLILIGSDNIALIATTCYLEHCYLHPRVAKGLPALRIAVLIRAARFPPKAPCGSSLSDSDDQAGFRFSPALYRSSGGLRHSRRTAPSRMRRTRH